MHTRHANRFSVSPRRRDSPQTERTFKHVNLLPTKKKVEKDVGGGRE
jgi:hypothetical protein